MQQNWNRKRNDIINGNTVWSFSNILDFKAAFASQDRVKQMHPCKSIAGILKNIAAKKIKAANVKDMLFLVTLQNPDQHVSELSSVFPCT